MMQGSDLLIESDDDSKLLDDIDQELTDLNNGDVQMSGVEAGGDWGPGITHAYPRHNIEGIPLLSDDSHFEDENDEDEDNTAISRPGREYTVEEAVESCGFGWFQVRIFLVCGLFSATDALEMLLLSVLSPELRCEWMLPEFKVALITTVVFIGMFSGSNIWGIGADKYGRLAIMKLAAVWIAYFGILCAFSPNYYWMLILRGLVGMGFGGAVQSWAYKSEYFPQKYRGLALNLGKIMWAMGSTFEVGLTRIVIAEYDMGWRWLVALSALPMLITIFFIWRLPESARYLVAAGRGDEALAVLREAAVMNKTKLPPGRLVQSKQEPRGKLSDLFSRSMRRTTLQLWLLWLGTAGSYYGIVLAQSEILEFHKSCGTEPSLEESPLHESCHCNKLSVADYNSMIYATLGEFVAIPLNILTIDTLGRRATLAIDFLFAGVFFLLIQICTTRTWLTIFIFGVRAFTAGIFNTVYIYTSEVYPTTVRSLGLGTCSACARIGAMVTPFIAQVMLKTSLTTSMWVYGLFCIACAVTALLLPIETKGRVMQQTTS